MRAKIAIAFLSISLLVSLGLASNQAFAGDPCEDCEIQFDICLAGTGGDPIKDSDCVVIYKSCLEDPEPDCPIDACIQCDFDVASCILATVGTQTPIDDCFATFDSCLATNQCFASVGGEFIVIDSTALLVTGAQMNAAWMIPVIVSGIGFAIVIARKF